MDLWFELQCLSSLVSLALLAVIWRVIFREPKQAKERPHNPKGSAQKEG